MSAAIHEAAHYVVARSMGFRPASVRLGPQGSGLFECYTPVPTKRDTLGPVRDTLAVLVAGRIAERIEAGENPVDRGQPRWEIVLRLLYAEGPAYARPDGTWAPDGYSWAIEELGRAYKNERLAHPAFHALAPGALRRALKILRAEWPEVIRLAERLEDEGEIVLTKGDTT